MRLVLQLCSLIINMSTALILPTYNRHDRLKNILNFYQKYDLNVYILDGSDFVFDDPILSSKNFHYFYFEPLPDDQLCPQGSYIRRLAFAFDHVDEEHAVLITDDDYFYPPTIEKCSAFLRKNPEFVSCMGFPYVVHQGSSKNSINVRHLYKNISPFSVFSDDSFSRNFQHFSSYTPRHVYAVTRTKLLKKVYKIFLEYSQVEIFSFYELMLEVSLSTHGKPCVLNAPYWIRGSAPKIKRSKPVKTLAEFLATPRDYKYILSFLKALVLGIYGQEDPEIYKCYCNAISTYLDSCYTKKVIPKTYGQSVDVSNSSALNIFQALSEF